MTRKNQTNSEGKLNSITNNSASVNIAVAPWGQNQCSEKILESLDNDIATILVNATYPQAVIEGIYQIKSYVNVALSFAIRADVLAKLNTLGASLMPYHLYEAEVFTAIHDLMTLVVNQVEARDQIEERLAHQEWNEIEKMAYWMTDWEDLAVGRAEVSLTSNTSTQNSSYTSRSDETTSSEFETQETGVVIPLYR